jgi:hypothetical protein
MKPAAYWYIPLAELVLISADAGLNADNNIDIYEFGTAEVRPII